MSLEVCRDAECMRLVRAEWTRTPNLTVKSGLLLPLSYARVWCGAGCVGRARTCIDLFQGQASYQLLDHAVGAWRRLRTADLRATRAMLWPSELSRRGEEPRAGVEPAAASYNVAALPYELSWLGLEGGSRTTGLEGR